MPALNNQGRGFIDGVSADVCYSEMFVVFALRKNLILPIAHFMHNVFLLDPSVIYCLILSQCNDISMNNSVIFGIIPNPRLLDKLQRGLKTITPRWGQSFHHRLLGSIGNRRIISKSQ